MRKLFFLPIFSFLLLTVSACDGDESLNPLAPKNGAMFMKLDIDPNYNQLVFDEIETTAFKGLLTNDSGNVVKYELFVRRTIDNVVTQNYVLLDTYTSFPHQMEITPAKLAEALNVPVSDLKEGHVFRFLAYAYDADGKRAGFNDLSRTVQVANFVEQGFKFNTAMTIRSKYNDQPYDNRKP